MNRLKLDILDVTPVFEIDLSKRVMSYLLGCDTFKQFSKAEILGMITSFPLESANFGLI